jgi:RimJ/RimL family protein N-acetyltransferase
VLIRRLAAADAEPYLALRQRMLREHPDAFTSSHDEEARRALAWTESRLTAQEAPPKFVLGAFSDDGALIGSVGLSGEERQKQRHKALLFGMFTAPEARGHGVGRALLHECLAQAAASPFLEQVILTVTEGNAAEKLYAAAGFERFGVEPRAIQVEGRYFGKVHMVRFLNRPPGARRSPGAP